MKILHIISEDKFLDIHVNRWENSEDEHTFVYLRPDLNYKGRHEQRIRKIQPFTPAYFALIEEAEQYDIIFIYLLNFHKAYLLNRIKKKPVVVWHFYGTELYRKSPFREWMISDETKKLLKKDRWGRLRHLLVYINLAKKILLNGSRRPSVEIDNAMRKVDHFWWYNRYEYNMFRKELPDLPAFLQLPVVSRMIEGDKWPEKKDQVLVGNSRASANNHIDTLMLLGEAKYRGRILMPFSYGNENGYARQLKKAIGNMQLDITLLEDFVQYEDYVNAITQSSAAIYNSYRQMALGNIFTTLYNGVKVYLDSRNPTYEWLKDTGFRIFTVNKHLKDDVMNGNLALSRADMEHNRRLFKEFVDPAHQHAFLRSLGGLRRQSEVVNAGYENIENIK